MTNVRITQAGPDDGPRVIALVQRLLDELGEEGEESGALDAAALTGAWRGDCERHFVLLAIGDDDVAIGVATVAESFAFYANGRYGIINEMYVAPGHRALGVGTRLLDAVRDLGKRRGWFRIDVTAPESPRWAGARRFYERHGFSFTGPKLKILLRGDA